MQCGAGVAWVWLGPFPHSPCPQSLSACSLCWLVGFPHSMEASKVLHDAARGLCVLWGKLLLATEVTGLHLCHTLLVTSVSSTAQSRKREIRPRFGGGTARLLKRVRGRGSAAGRLGKTQPLHCPGLTPNKRVELLKSLFLIFFSL